MTGATLQHPLVLQDAFGRRFPYLRLSVTDVCNFRCGYCLPNGYERSCAQDFLTIAEIRRLVTAFAELGTWKIRLTGGEPTTRRDLADIARVVSTIPGIRHLALTTNGYRLEEKAAEYVAAGFNAVNVSIDSLDPATFAGLTGHDRLPAVIAGVDAALEAGFEKVKVNTVLLKGVNDAALANFIAFIADRPVSLRFIELMQTGDNPDYFRRYHTSSAALHASLLTAGWQMQPREEGAGPAVEYHHAAYQGRIGIIAPYAKDFCASCNRLRVSAKGDLHLCLFGEQGHSLRHLLQDDGQLPLLQTRIAEALQQKRIGHFLHEEDPGIRRHFAAIGG